MADSIPADDPHRQLTVARPDADVNLRHLAVVGNVYTILVSGKDTAGRYALIDMYVLPGGGPPPHRHDFEEMFHVLDGEIEAAFRGQKLTVKKGETINIPANAPHSFVNASDQAARLLCMVTPAGQEEFFELVGQPVATRTTVPPPADAAAKAEGAKKAAALMPRFRTEPA